MAMDMTEKEILNMQLEQLRKETKLERLPISKTAKDLKDFVDSNAAEDPLLKPIPDDKNPFKEKGGCIIT